jgi:hypothetical protein
MKTFSRVAVATFAMVGVSFAQPAPTPAPAKPAPTTAKPAPAPTPTKTPDAAMKKAPDALKADPKGAPVGTKPAMPKAPQEVADLAKTMTGTWRCKGEGVEMDGSKKPMTATSRTKADLDKWWIVDTFDGKTGTGPTATAYKFVAYTTFDAASKKWRRYMVDNMGGHMVGTSDGLKEGKMTFNMDAWSPMGAAMFRDYTDTTDAKAGVKFWGEMSMDKGKTWVKAYEMACKK